MAEFFEKISNAVTFEVQMYILMAVFFVMIVFCFIMLLIVGLKYKQLSSKVDELGAAKEGGEKADDAEYAWIKEYINNTLQEGKASAQEDQKAADPDAARKDDPADGDLAAAEKEDPSAAENESAEKDDGGSAGNEGGETDGEKAVSAEESGESSGSGEDAAGNGETAAAAAIAAAGYDPAFVDETNRKLAEISAEIDTLTEKTRDVEKKVSDTAALQRKGFDKIKVVRYISPEEDGKSAPGYSIGITNQDCEGIVLTGITREDSGTTLEVKSIRNGVSNTPLSKAEECAVMRKNKE